MPQLTVQKIRLPILCPSLAMRDYKPTQLFGLIQNMDVTIMLSHGLTSLQSRSQNAASFRRNPLHRNVPRTTGSLWYRFMRTRLTVRVTAAIGSPYRRSASDNPSKSKDPVERLGCDEIHQYHNHPVHNGMTKSSPTDFSSSRSLKSVLQPHGGKLRSFIICWNGIREWKVFEYEGEGKCWLQFEFDASVDTSHRSALP